MPNAHTWFVLIVCGIVYVIILWFLLRLARIGQGPTLITPPTRNEVGVGVGIGVKVEVDPDSTLPDIYSYELHEILPVLGRNLRDCFNQAQQLVEDWELEQVMFRVRGKRADTFYTVRDGSVSELQSNRWCTRRWERNANNGKWELTNVISR